MIHKLTGLFISMIFFLVPASFSQVAAIDSNKQYTVPEVSTKSNSYEQSYDVGNGKTFIYTKPRPFGFLTRVPSDACGIVSSTFKKQSLKPLIMVTGATLALLFADQSFSNGLHHFSSQIHFHSDEDYKNVLDLKMGKTDISLLKAPKNLNTALYQMGQGFPSMLISAGLFTYGKIHNDYRALNTASELAEVFILMGAGTQLLKRMTGRQSPSNALDEGGQWHFFPSFKSFQKNTPNFDAFPSGHLATLMSTITVLTENYPEKKYIKPIGYSLTGLIALAMVNNDVHWLSDYPLALGLGYLCAKQVVKNNRRVLHSSLHKRKQPKAEYSFTMVDHRLHPQMLLTF